MAQSFIVQPTVFPFDPANLCGECLIGGNVFCVKKSDNFTVPKDELLPSSRCCQPDTDDKECKDIYEDTDWYCSHQYNETVYSLTGLCPK